MYRWELTPCLKYLTTVTVASAASTPLHSAGSSLYVSNANSSLLRAFSCYLLSLSLCLSLLPSRLLPPPPFFLFSLIPSSRVLHFQFLFFFRFNYFVSRDSCKFPLHGNDKFTGCYFAVIPHQPCLTITH